MVGSLFHSRKYLTLSTMLYHYKSQIRPKIGILLSHLAWSYPIFTFQPWVQKHVCPCRWLIFSTVQPLSHRWIHSSFTLLYCYFLGRCSGRLYSWVIPVQTFIDRTHYAMYTNSFAIFMSVAWTDHFVWYIFWNGWNCSFFNLFARGKKRTYGSSAVKIN